LGQRFARGDEKLQSQIYRTYLENLEYVNNWDLVDSSAPSIVGEYLLARKRTELTRLAQSASLWSRRVAIVATLAFIRRADFTSTLAISTLLLNDEEDLIHKASGWMLREVGKRDAITLCTFLNQHVRQMPRTMLRYAIERLPESQRLTYLNQR
jgi:3-methyladenine DNA glycosylase AlkD